MAVLLHSMVRTPLALVIVMLALPGCSGAAVDDGSTLDASPSRDCAAETAPVDDAHRVFPPGVGASFIQMQRALISALQGSEVDGINGNVTATCTDLTNHGTHFTVDIEVGTPGQKFSVVADTGSNSLIIPSCVCQQRRYCAKSDRCFTGTNRSSSFSLKDGPKGLQSVFITFGSGTIEAIVAKEKVGVGHLNVDMKGGILLMVARNLNIVGKFEGILGLGLPAEKTTKSHKHHNPSGKSGSNTPMKDMMNKIMGDIFGGSKPEGNLALAGADVGLLPAYEESGDASLFPWQSEHSQFSEDMPRDLDGIGDIIDGLDQETDMRAFESMRLAKADKLVPGLNRQSRGNSMHHSDDPQESGPKGLLEQAGISRFSMCFNDGASGVLNLGIPEMTDSLGSVGKFHWGLDFRGITIGDSTVPLSICSAENMTNGQETPCGAIPDSGTTVIMAPKEHLSLLLDSICDSWPRCAQNYTAMVKAAEAAKKGATEQYSWDPFEIIPAAKSTVLQLLLLDCGSWLNDTTDLSELPSLKFKMAGAAGNEKTLELPAWAYILESTRDDAETNKQFQGMADSDVVFLQKKMADSNRDTKPRKVCSPAFGAMDYNTQKNGPVWILGTPFFYEFHVGYDLHSSPPSISFKSTSETPCVSCGKQTSLMSTSAVTNSKDYRRPRWISGHYRRPDMDTDLPL